MQADQSCGKSWGDMDLGEGSLVNRLMRKLLHDYLNFLLCVLKG